LRLPVVPPRPAALWSAAACVAQLPPGLVVAGVRSGESGRVVAIEGWVTRMQGPWEKWGFPKMGVPLYRWMVYLMENPIKILLKWMMQGPPR